MEAAEINCSSSIIECNRQQGCEVLSDVTQGKMHVSQTAEHCREAQFCLDSWKPNGCCDQSCDRPGGLEEVNRTEVINDAKNCNFQQHQTNEEVFLPDSGRRSRRFGLFSHLIVRSVRLETKTETFVPI